MKKSGMPAMKGAKKVNPFAKGGKFEAFKKAKGFAGGGAAKTDSKGKAQK